MPHIEVKLDFIPVEERKPVGTGWRYVIVEGVGLPSRALWEETDRGEGMWCDWQRGQPTVLNWKITHWAEIPQVSDAS